MSWYERSSTWLENNPFKVDLMVTAALCGAGVPASIGFASGQAWFFGYDYTGIWTAVFAFALIGPLCIRRVYPLLTAVIIYAVAALHILIGPALILPADLATLIVMYSVALHAPRWARGLTLGVSVIGSAVAASAFANWTSLGFNGLLLTFFSITLLFVVAWAFGLMRRTRVQMLTALTAKNLSLEIERDQQVLLGAATERSRIAREMHDIVAHSLSVIIAQADGGRYAAAAKPEMAATSLAAIAETGRAALAAMRRLLVVLRDDTNLGVAPAPGQGVAERAPQPAGESIENLIDSLRHSGVRVSLARTGAPRLLPPGAGLTMYRVAQESLTNVLKHAGSDPTVTVLVNWRSEGVYLAVTDDGGTGDTPLIASDGSGMGLLGMRERAALFGGTLTAEPTATGGFQVQLFLPLAS